MKQIVEVKLEGVRFTGNETTFVKMPGHPQFIGVKEKADGVYIVAVTSPIFDDLQHEFGIYGTGEMLQDALGNFVGTFQHREGKGKSQTIQDFHLYILRREVGKKEEEG